MEDLIEDMYALNIDAQIEAQHPFLTDGEPCDITVKISDSVVRANTPEHVCHLRWPHYGTEEKYRLELRTNKPVAWDVSMRQIDAEMEIWQKDDHPIQAMPFHFLPYSRRPTQHKKLIEKHKIENIFSLAIGPEAAVVLESENGGRSGVLWWFPIHRIQIEGERHWRRVESSRLDGPKLKPVHRFQACYLLRHKLYLVDGLSLRIIDIVAGEQLAELPLYTGAMLANSASIRSLVVTLSGLGLFQLQDTGMVYLFDVRDEQLRMIRRFQHARETHSKLTAYSIAPVSEQTAELLLGSESGQVERWDVCTSQDGKLKVEFDATIDLLGNKMSTVTHREIEVKPGVPITYLYNRGRRMIICTPYNRIVIDDSPKVPIFFFKEDPSTRVCQVDICGDLMFTLQNNGVFRGAPFISTISPIQERLRDEFIPSDYMDSNCQRITILPDLAVGLGKMGQLLFMTHTEIPGARVTKSSV